MTSGVLLVGVPISLLLVLFAKAARLVARTADDGSASKEFTQIAQWMVRQLTGKGGDGDEARRAPHP